MASLLSKGRVASPFVKPLAQGREGSPKLQIVVGIVVFPGSNCEHDVVESLGSLDAKAQLLWHSQADLQNSRAIVLPGGFAHGDYLRPGAIAKFSNIMNSVVEFARAGGPVLGICNGFQILTEVGLLPGALQKNRGLRFICEMSQVVVSTANSSASRQLAQGAQLSIPINHFEGNFTCSHDTLEQLQQEDRIVFRYLNNPNGSIDDIAGITNETRNVVGMMPHPERACDPMLGSSDGIQVLASLLEAAQ